MKRKGKGCFSWGAPASWEKPCVVSSHVSGPFLRNASQFQNWGSSSQKRPSPTDVELEHPASSPLFSARDGVPCPHPRFKNLPLLKCTNSMLCRRVGTRSHVCMAERPSEANVSGMRFCRAAFHRSDCTAAQDHPQSCSNLPPREQKAPFFLSCLRTAHVSLPNKAHLLFGDTANFT